MSLKNLAKGQREILAQVMQGWAAVTTAFPQHDEQQCARLCLFQGPTRIWRWSLAAPLLG